MSIFTKKHYESLALKLHQIHFRYRGLDGDENHACSRAPLFIAENLCKNFLEDNPNFDQERFMKIVRNGTTKSLKEILLGHEGTIS